MLAGVQREQERQGRRALQDHVGQDELADLEKRAVLEEVGRGGGSFCDTDMLAAACMRSTGGRSVRGGCGGGGRAWSRPNWLALAGDQPLGWGWAFMRGGGRLEKEGAVGLLLAVGVGASPWFWTRNCRRRSVSALLAATAVLMTGEGEGLALAGGVSVGSWCSSSCACTAAAAAAAAWTYGQ